MVRPSQAGILAFIPSSKGGAVLIEGVEKTGRGGKKRIVPKPGGHILYILKKSTLHKPDATVLPGISEMTAAAREAAEEFIAAISTT